MHLVEHFGDALHLVDHDPAFVRARKAALEAARIREELEVDLGVEQIEPWALGEAIAQPGRFPRAARAEQEKASIGDALQSGIHSSVFVTK